jgi:hypothetical protein
MASGLGEVRFRFAGLGTGLEQSLVMPAIRAPIVMLSALAGVSLVSAAASAAAATDAQAPALSGAAAARVGNVGPGPWLVRAEASLVEMRDNWLDIPVPEIGLTVGRDLAPRLSVELTGSAREVDSDHRSWSVLAAGRVAALRNATGRHALTIAAGPFFELGNPVHGDLPFAHTEVAYVYRAPFGLTVLAGGGLNIALATSRYVAPPPTKCPDGGDAVVLCIDLGPDAQEIHAGDTTVHARLAVGWQF